MIQITNDLSPEQEIALREYLRGAERLSPVQWQHLREVIDVLSQSIVTFQGRDYTFAQFYDAHIDRQFAESFLQSLVATIQVAQEAPRLQATTARQIVQWVQQQDFYRKGQIESRLLLTFCLYWWGSFALGYTFEEEIFRDLRAEGIEFASHDLTNRNERLSPFDLIVLGLRGDIKYSTWFLTVENAQLEGLDFFITRLYVESGAQWLHVVLLTPIAQEVLNVDSGVSSLTETVSGVPTSMTAGTTTLQLIDYTAWKVCVRSKQTSKGSENDG